MFSGGIKNTSGMKCVKYYEVTTMTSMYVCIYLFAIIKITKIYNNI